MTPPTARVGRARRTRWTRGRVGLTAVVLCLIFGPSVGAQRAPAQNAPTAQATASKAAVQRVPIDFTVAHGYAAAVDYLKKVSSANPGITDLVEIGKSAGGRSIYVLVVSSMKTGVVMDALVPLQHPRTPAVNNVVAMKPYQGKPGQWIDGGVRGADPAGTEACLYIIDRLVSGYGTDAEITKLVDDDVFYMCPIVNPDGSGAAVDGKRSAADAATNGNFPEGWWKDDSTPGGTGAYPSSSPEARGVLEFFTNHTNILLVQSFDATGGYTVRPFARWPESRVDPRDVAILDGVIGKKYQEMVGQPGAPRAWRGGFNAERQAPAAYGAFTDWAYGQFGAYAMSTQVSDPQGGSLDKWCDAAWQFERYKATLLPRLQIKEATAKLLYTTNQATKATVGEPTGDTVIVKKGSQAGRYQRDRGERHRRERRPAAHTGGARHRAARQPPGRDLAAWRSHEDDFSPGLTVGASWRAPGHIAAGEDGRGGRPGWPRGSSRRRGRRRPRRTWCGWGLAARRDARAASDPGGNAPDRQQPDRLVAGRRRGRHAVEARADLAEGRHDGQGPGHPVTPRSTSMRTHSLRNCLLALAVILVAASAWMHPVRASVPQSGAPQKPQTSPAGNHGELDFPINWKQYYSYAEKTKIMQGLQKQYSQLADLSSIGKSRMGRDQWMLTITAKSTGAPDAKPAMWVDGAIHGNEINGVTCSLYLAWYLLTRYDYDPYVKDLVDHRTFYILPGLNVDANDSYATEPNTENNPREPYRMEDNDGDGLYDEDLTEDVDGDGEISMMWIEDPEGDFKLSLDRRRFVPVTDPREAGVRFRRLGMEGYDNDGDGRVNEDDLGGPDPNRNFPFGWTLQDGWPYPMSENETRNVFEFQLKHPNIFASFHYHNTGRLIMFMAPPDTRANLTPEQRHGGRGASRRPARRNAQDRPLRAALLARRGARLAERHGHADGHRHRGRAHPEGLHADLQRPVGTGAGRLLQHARRLRVPDRAVGPAAALRRGPQQRRNRGRRGIPGVDRHRSGLAKAGSRRTSSIIRISETCGSAARRRSTPGRTPPAPYMETEALRQTHFALYCAGQFPKVEIENVAVTPATGDLFWVDARVKNDRVYPTFSDRALQLKRAVPDKLTIATSNNVSLVELPAGALRVDPLNEQATATPMTGKTADFRLRGRDSARFRALVKISGADGWVEVKTESKFGGVDTKRIAVKVSGT